jgi:hypothetical protein
MMFTFNYNPIQFIRQEKPIQNEVPTYNDSGNNRLGSIIREEVNLQWRRYFQ